MVWKIIADKQIVHFLMVLILCPLLSFAEDTGVKQIDCNSQAVKSKLFAELNLLDHDLEAIRVVIGKKKPSKNIILVTEASPREIYFEAENTHQKLNRLSYEISGIYQHITEVQKSTITMCDINGLLKQSLTLIMPITKQLNISNKNTKQTDDTKVNNAQIYNMFLDINKQINNLSYQKTMPSNVYSQVTLSIHYLENVLVYLKISNDLPTETAKTSIKTPSDVYKEMLQNLYELQVIFKNSSLSILNIEIRNGLTYLQPDDVMSLANITLAEVRYLATFLPYEIKLKNYHYGYKTPSDVYTQVKILKLQLDELEKYTAKNPDWTRRGIDD